MEPRERLPALEAENESLRARVRELEEALMGGRAIPLEWGLTPSESRVMGVLANRALATKDAIMAALYTDIGRDEAEEKVCNVFICKIRKKIAPFGIAIETVWGQGWRISEELRQRLKGREAA